MSIEGSRSQSLGLKKKKLFLSGRNFPAHHQKEAPHSHIFTSVVAQVSLDLYDNCNKYVKPLSFTYLYPSMFIYFKFFLFALASRGGV